MFRRLLNRKETPAPAPPAQPETEYPRVVQLETTSVCNLRCTMCPTTYFPTNRTLSPELFAPVFEAVPHLLGIVPFLGGEPLLYGQFFELLAGIRERSDSVFVGFNSNATMFDEETCRQLVDLKVTEVIVSMDGATADTYNRIRVRGDFDTTLASIRRLVNARGTSAFPAMGLLVVASRQNVHEVPGLVRLAGELGLTKVIVNGLDPYSADSASQVCYAARPDPAHEAFMAQAADEARRQHIEFHAPSLRVTREKLYCPALSICLVRADGEVYPCYPYCTDDTFYYHGRETRHLGPLSFGNIGRTPLGEIWNSGAYREFRERLRQRHFHPECHQCLVSEGIVCNLKLYPL